MQKIVLDAEADGMGSTVEFALSTYAHEMGHGCALYHHGETDIGNVLWVVTDAPNGLTWKEKGAVIIPLGEVGQVLLAPAMDTNGVRQITPYVGSQQGQHSGNTGCVMRYDSAHAYQYPSGSATRYVTGGGEVSGTLLCLSGAGTGVNAPGRQPRPRFGEAFAGRGNCASQLCVNDKYVSDATHHR